MIWWLANTLLQNNSTTSQITNFAFTFKVLNIKKFSEDFRKALLASQASVEVSVTEIENTNLTEKYGIFALLGTGKSIYTGSIPGRI